MMRATALKTLEKMIGKKLAYRVDPKAPSPEDREAARAALVEAIEESRRAKESKEMRYASLLGNDAEFQRLKAEAKAAAEKAAELSAKTRHFKITVGKAEGMFFVVKAEGDSWEDVIAKIKAKGSPA